MGRRKNKTVSSRSSCVMGFHPWQSPFIVVPVSAPVLSLLVIFWKPTMVLLASWENAANQVILLLLSAMLVSSSLLSLSQRWTWFCLMSNETVRDGHKHSLGLIVEESLFAIARSHGFLPRIFFSDKHYISVYNGLASFKKRYFDFIYVLLQYLPKKSVSPICSILSITTVFFYWFDIDDIYTQKGSDQA